MYIVNNIHFCHSGGNLTKWFDEVNLNCTDSSGMTKRCFILQLIDLRAKNYRNLFL